MAPLVKPVASVMLLMEVALYPYVSNKIPDFLRIVSLVTSGLRMHKDTNWYLKTKNEKPN